MTTQLLHNTSIYLVFEGYVGQYQESDFRYLLCMSYCLCILWICLCVFKGYASFECCKHMCMYVSMYVRMYIRGCTNG